jgi:hypothetical protein
MFQRTRIAPAPEFAAASARIVEAISRGCTAFPLLGSTAKADRVRRQIDAGAWADAAVLLVALELSDWHIRRIEWDDGEWFSSITWNPGVPSGFDDAVDGRHSLLSLAIIDALMETKRRSLTAAALVGLAAIVRF